MAYDLAVWSPAIGGAGVDRYDPPPNTRMLAGDVSGFSLLPAIAEINLSSDWNQVAGLTNRRMQRFAELFGARLTGASNATPIVITYTSHQMLTLDIVCVSGVLGNTAANGHWVITKINNNTFSLNGSVGNGAYTSGGGFCRFAKGLTSIFGGMGVKPAYVTQNTKILSSWMTNLRNCIDAVRFAEGFAAYTYATSLTDLAAGKKIFGSHLADLRKALEISGTLTIQKWFPRAEANLLITTYRRIDNPYLTPFFEAFTDEGVGVAGDSASPPVSRGRYLFAYAVPDWVSALASAKLSISGTNIRLGNPSAEVWLSNSNDWTALLTPAYAGSAYHFDTLLGTFDESNLAYQDVAIPNADIISRAGTGLSIILATDKERLGSAVNGQWYESTDQRLEIIF